MAEEKNKTCKLCPSYLTAEQADDFYGKSIGAPMCARFGKVLGAPGVPPLAENKMQDAIAEKCSGFGEPKPARAPGYLQTEVLTPDADAVVEHAKSPASDLEKQQVNTCRNCTFYIKPETVSGKFGYTAGACRQTGRLLVTSRLSKEAEDCETRKYGPVRDGMSMINLLPMYAEAKAFDPSALGKFIKARESGDLDPFTYEGMSHEEYEDEYGFPVADQVEQGIRTWRPIEDTRGSGKKTYIPVFDPDSFPESERAKIPETGDKEHPEFYIDADNNVYTVSVLWMELDESPYLWGRPGVGKTEIIRHLAWLMAAPFDRISITTEMEVEDLIGKMQFGNGETYFQKGRLPLRWEKRGCLVIDEYNAAPDPVMQRLRPITDNSKELVLDESAGEAVTRNDFTFLAATGNPAWDIRNLGTRDMADADLDRMTHIYMELPNKEVEFEILKTRTEEKGIAVDEDQLEKVLLIAEEIRGLVDDGVLPVSWGLRPNLKVLGNLAWFDPITAYKRAILDALDPESRDMVLKIVTTKVVW